VTKPKPSKTADQLRTAMALMGVGVDEPPSNPPDSSVPTPPALASTEPPPDPSNAFNPDNQSVPTALGVKSGLTYVRISFEVTLAERYTFRRLAKSHGLTVREVLSEFVRACNAAGRIPDTKEKNPQ
jgi:hypothetical protein